MTMCACVCVSCAISHFKEEEKPHKHRADFHLLLNYSSIFNAIGSKRAHTAQRPIPIDNRILINVFRFDRLRGYTTYDGYLGPFCFPSCNSMPFPINTRETFFFDLQIDSQWFSSILFKFPFRKKVTHHISIKPNQFYDPSEIILNNFELPSKLKWNFIWRGKVTTNCKHTHTHTVFAMNIIEKRQVWFWSVEDTRIVRETMRENGNEMTAKLNLTREKRDESIAWNQTMYFQEMTKEKQLAWHSFWQKWTREIFCLLRSEHSLVLPLLLWRIRNIFRQRRIMIIFAMESRIFGGFKRLLIGEILNAEKSEKKVFQYEIVGFARSFASNNLNNKNST